MIAGRRRGLALRVAFFRPRVGLLFGLLFGFLFGLLFGLLGSGAAHAHSFAPAVLTLRENPDGAYAVHLQTPRGGPGASELLPEFPAHCQFRGEPKVLDCGSRGLRGSPIRIRTTRPLRIDVLIVVQWQGGAASTGVVSSSDEAFMIPAAASVPESGARSSAFRAARRFIPLGIRHILTGADHLLFVFGLLWLVRTPLRLLRTITAFTVAHSVTLSLCVLGVIAPPSALVELFIALSILFLARELLREPQAQTLTQRHPESLAFLFGLLHGLGFAGALTELGLPRAQIPLALLCFNVGVELGQLAFVLFAALVLRGVWRIFYRRPDSLLHLLPAYVLGSVAAAWTIARAQLLFSLHR